MTDPTEAVERLAAAFAEEFKSWGFRLLREHMRRRQRGKIVARGWAIWYCFGRDDRGEYLDYYSSHRMTSDDHIRLRPAGEVEALPALPWLRRSSADPVEEARLEAEFRAECRAIADMLKAKGFFIEGDEPGGVAINMLLRSGDITLPAPDDGRPSGDAS